MQTDDVLKPGDEESFLGVEISEVEVEDDVIDEEDIIVASEIENSLAMLHQEENPENQEIYEFFVDDEDELDKWN